MKDTALNWDSCIVYHFDEFFELISFLVSLKKDFQKIDEQKGKIIQKVLPN